MGFNERVRNWLDRGRYREFETRWDDRLLRAAVLTELGPTKECSTSAPAPESFRR